MVRDRNPPCPTCGVPLEPAAEHPFRPFCSKRCKLVDLDRWFEGDYRIPGPPVDPETNPDPTSAMPGAGEA